MRYSERDIHIVQGYSGAAELRSYLGASKGRIYLHRDVLSYGPLTSVDKLDRWETLRWAFWGMKGKPKPDDWLHRQLSADRDRLHGAERIFLWLGTELAQPILAGWLVAFFKQLGVDTARFRLPDLSPLPYRGKPLPSIGVLSAEQLGKIERWLLLTDDDLSSFVALWQAVSSPCVQGLIAFCAPDAPHARSLKQAGQAYMAHYPAVDDGLTAWDRVLLKNCGARSMRTAKLIGNTMGHDMPYPDWPGEEYLFDRLKRLGGSDLPHPLVRLSGDASAMRTTEARLTKAGESVLERRDNFIALNGLDDWVGGVHLSSKQGNVWFHNGATLIPGGSNKGAS